LVVVDPPGLAEIQDKLPHGVLLVEYFHPGQSHLLGWHPDELCLFVLSSSDLMVERIHLTEQELERTARDFCAAVAEPSGSREVIAGRGAKLYEWLISPIGATVDASDTLVIVPWGPLSHVPFGAMPCEDGTPLGERKQIVSAPSAAVYTSLHPKGTDSPQSIAAFGSPTTALTPLPGAEKEVQAITGLFNRERVFLRDEATETRLKETGRDTEVLHVACHGKLNRKLPQFSYLALSPDAENDGQLEMHEIVCLDLTEAALVTLSACSSGTGELGGGQELQALSRAFMLAGAPSVLCTLWDVDDEATRVLMEYFYREYTSGKSKAESLKIAQTRLRSEPKWSHPYYWAPFTLWGHWR